MSLKAFQTGQTSVSSVFNYNVPTNPKLTTESTFSGDKRLFTVIYPDDSNLDTITEFGSSANTSYSNLETTEGFRIKCFDSASQEGIQFNPSTSDLASNDYYVLIHADDENKHHLAKITEVLAMDSTGDGFEFTPKLGNELEENTKFRIYSIPSNTTALAVSFGIKLENQNKLVVARPMFCFDNDTLHKKDELDHNTKYFAIHEAEGSSTTIDLSSAIAARKATILTTEAYAGTIVDYSKYSMKLELFDNLRNLDNPSNSPYKSNEDITITLDYKDYDTAFPNARSDTDDNVASTGLYIQKGFKRYPFYDFSPTKNNTLYNTIDANIQQAIEQRGGFAQVKLSDSFRIMPKKVSEFDSLRVRHAVHSAILTDFFPLSATVLSVLGTNQYNFQTDHDLKDFLNPGDEVKVKDTHLLVQTIAAFGTSKTQAITFRNITRTKDDAAFSVNTYVPAVGEVLHRGAFKPTATQNGASNTLLTDFVMMENRFTNLFVEFIVGGFAKLVATATATDPDKKLITLSFDGTQYYDSAYTNLEFADGAYSIQVERLDGEIETIKSYKKDGQTFMELEGRDKFNKLLSPIVNRDFLFSEDIIYSSISPYNKLEALSPTITCDFDTAVDALTFSSSLTLTKGDHIFVKHTNGTFGYVGEIATTNTGTTHTLQRTPMVEGSTLAAYKASNKNYIFNKALASNPLVESSTSLSGASDKGVIFNAGRNISRATFSETLAGTSASANGMDLGYDISNCKGIKSDNAFQGTLDNETFDIANTLIDFTIFDVQEDGRNKIVKVAPYIPLSLGRVEVNYANTQDITFRSLGTTSSAKTDSRYIETTQTTYLSSLTTPRNFHNRPIYINSVFAGFIIGVQLQTDYTTVRVYVDRKVSYSSGDSLSVLTYSSTYEESTKLTHELQLLNAGHLHTGKFICLLNSQFNSNREPIMFNYPLYYPTMGSNPKTHTERFGPSLYRLFNIEKGNIHRIKSLYSDTGINISKTSQYYSDKLSKVKFYASGYKMNFGHYIASGSLDENIIGTDIMHIAHHKMPETRGYTSVRGSNFFDTTVHSTGETFNLMRYEDFTDSESGYFTKDIFYQPDAKAARMFLFINCDLTPYSSTRFDSLMAGSPYTKTIENYSLLALKKPKTAGRSDDKDLILGQSETINLKDNEYTSASILSADKTISSLKRFSIMRLTEVVYDWHFNQIDPENIVSNDRTIRKTTNNEYKVSTLHSSASITHPVGGDNTKIKYSATVSVAAGDLVFDSNGRFMGTVQSLSTTDISNDTITFDANVIKTDGTSVAGTPHTKMTPTTQRTSDSIRGHGSEDTVILNSDIHMLKSFVVNSVSSGYGRTSSAWHNYYGTFLENSASTNRKPNLFLPVDLGDNARGSSNTHYSSHVIQMYRDGTTDIDVVSPTFQNDDLTLKDFRAIFFDRYTIEEGINLVDKGMVSDYITGMSFSEDTAGPTLGLVAFKTDENFGENESVNKTGGSSATTADGVFMGFKPEITLPTATANNKSVGNKTVYYYRIEATGENHFLNYVDLTGTYLVNQVGKYYDADGAIQTSSDGQSLNELTITDLAYVISHELDHTSSAHFHILTLDNDMGGDVCRIMQPNHTCFYSYSPKEIQLNTLSSKYTKMGNEDRMYESINAYQFRNAKGTRSNDSNNEGVLSAYIILDIDNQPDLENFIFVKDSSSFSTLFGNMKLDMGISDGETSFISSVEYTDNGDAIGHYLNFGELKECLGVVSVSETINLTVNGDITTEHKRTMIGAGVQIAREAQDIVNDLLESEGLTYETDGTTSYHLAPNFESIDLFSAINFVLKKINKTVFVEGDKYKLKDNQSDDLYSSNIKIGDEANVKVFEFEKSSTIFNFYNDITVYGRAHKSTRKDLRSIQKVGRKSFEHTDKTLVNQTEVDEKARELFSLYNRNNQKIELLVNHENISTLQVGDIVNVEIQQENIPLSSFLVLQMEHQLTGLIKLQLGRYSRLLEDTLAEIVATTRKNEKDSRSATLTANEQQFFFLEEVKVNLRKLLVRKRVSSGGNALGFSAQLNTGSRTLGFSGGSGVVLTDLLEEEF